RYRRRRRMQTAKRARFGLASSTFLALNKPLRAVGSYGRLALLGQKPKSASRTSPITFAVLSRWSEWPPHDGVVCPVRMPAQPVDATQALNLSAGVSNCKVSRGRSKRFELLTPRFVVWCSIQLSYGR